jgi:hypothetical protein
MSTTVDGVHRLTVVAFARIGALDLSVDFLQLTEDWLEIPLRERA